MWDFIATSRGLTWKRLQYLCPFTVVDNFTFNDGGIDHFLLGCGLNNVSDDPLA
jgi:hypothetical protein